MKKIYRKPEVNVGVMEIKNHLMEASGTDIKDVNAPSGAEGLSRQGRFWDEEDDE